MHIYKQTYNGFVYLWHDTHRNKFYLGSHRGSMDDGYICSNIIFNRVYRKRQDKCKRRILQTTLNEDIKSLHILEQNWLNLIKDEELCGIKYYNMKKTASGGSGRGPKLNKPTSALHKYRSPESNLKRSKTLKSHSVTPASRQKMSLAKVGKPNKHQSKQCTDGIKIYNSLTNMAKDLSLSIEGARRRILNPKLAQYSYC